MVKRDSTKEMYDFIVEYVKEHLYAPSVKEIQEYIGFKSLSAVKYQIDKLVKLGYIEQNEGQPRTIKVLGYELVKKKEDKEEEQV